MARRRSQSVVYAPAPSGMGDSPGGSIVSAGVYAILVFVVCLVILYTCGPVIDYFGAYMSTMPADAAGYANPVLELFPWTYTFIILAMLIPIVMIVIVAIRAIQYQRYGD